MSEIPAHEYEISKEESDERGRRNEVFGAEFKNWAKRNSWRFKGEFAFRELDGWFVSASAAIWIGRRRTAVEFHCKPMALDPLFWAIVDAEQNSKLPLSFRCTGGWTCSTPPYAEYNLEGKHSDPKLLASDTANWLESQTAQSASWSVDHFLKSVQKHQKGPHHRATIITTHLLLDDFLTAESICKDAIARGDACGYGIGGENFPHLALKWLSRHRKTFC